MSLILSARSWNRYPVISVCRTQHRISEWPHDTCSVPCHFVPHSRTFSSNTVAQIDTIRCFHCHHLSRWKSSTNLFLHLLFFFIISVGVYACSFLLLFLPLCSRSYFFYRFTLLSFGNIFNYLLSYRFVNLKAIILSSLIIGLVFFEFRLF